MPESKNPRLTAAAVRARYNDPSNYKSTDGWHVFTERETRHYLNRFWQSRTHKKGSVVLNAGAGDNELGFHSCLTINLDISETRVSSLPNSVGASVEALPLADQSLDTVVCVGSVINYCDAAAAVSEFARVLRPNGYLLLEFESSRSAELMTQDAFGRSAGVVETFYGDEHETVWAYAPDFINHILNAAHFVVHERLAIHILSPWALLLLRSKRVATALAGLDPLVRHLPLLTRWASNHLFICERVPD